MKSFCRCSCCLLMCLFCGTWDLICEVVAEGALELATADEKPKESRLKTTIILTIKTIILVVMECLSCQRLLSSRSYPHSPLPLVITSLLPHPQSLSHCWILPTHVEAYTGISYLKSKNFSLEPVFPSHAAHFHVLLQDQTSQKS